MIFSKFERMTAARYLRAKRKEGFISVISGFAFIGIALGVATLIIVMSVMNGFKSELLSRILGLGGHITVAATPEFPFTNYAAAAEAFENMEGVQSAVPLIERQILISTPHAAEGAMVRGMDKTDIIRKDILRKGFAPLDLETFEGDVVVLGARLAQKLGVLSGETVTLISPQGKLTAFGTMPRMKTYTVLGTFDVGMYEYDSAFIYMPLETAQKFFGLHNAATQIDITLKKADVLPFVRSALEESVGMDAYVYDWKQTNSAFFNALDVERNVMFLILTLIILVAAFNIITALIMLVQDKGRDIAVLRTMGATKGMIIRIFFMDGAFIGVVGTLIGFGIGIAFCAHIESIRQFLENLSGRELFSAEIYFLSQLPAEVNWTEVYAVGIVSLLLSFLATLYPAYRAARMNPVEALHYE